MMSSRNPKNEVPVRHDNGLYFCPWKLRSQESEPRTPASPETATYAVDFIPSGANGVGPIPSRILSGRDVRVIILRGCYRSRQERCCLCGLGIIRTGGRGVYILGCLGVSRSSLFPSPHSFPSDMPPKIDPSSVALTSQDLTKLSKKELAKRIFTLQEINKKQGRKYSA